MRRPCPTTRTNPLLPPGGDRGRGGRVGERSGILSQMSTEEGDPTTGQPSVDARGRTVGKRSVRVDYVGQRSG